MRKLPSDIFDFTIIHKTLKIVWEASRKHTIIRLILLIVNSLLPLIPIYLFKLLLDEFAGNIQNVDTNYVIGILVGLILLSLFGIILGNVSAYNNSLQADIIADHMSKVIIDKALFIDLEFFDSDKYHDQFSRAMGQGGTKPLAVLGSVTGLLKNAIMLTAIIGLLFTLHWSIIFILFIITLPSAYIKFIYSEKTITLAEEQTQTNRLNGYYKGVLTGGGSAKEVRMFSFGDYLLERFLSIARLLRKERRDLYLEQLKWVSFAQSAQVITISVALGFIIYKALQGDMTVGDISMYYMVFQKGQGNVKSIMSSFIGLHKQKLTMNYLFEFLEMNKKVVNTPTPVAMVEEINSVTIKDLNFIYPGTTNVVLEGVNFTMNKGELIAIVGENGSGKTTLVKLINRLYNPTEGEIFFNDTPYQNFSLEDLRKKITVIFQKFSSYALTVKENITISDVDQEVDMQKVMKAAELATATKFIKRLPLNFETRLGRVFEDGHELSKGQWQKIALARAFYKQGDIIVLDEPTSFIDPIAEDEIFQNFRRISKNKILVLITHRIYNLVQADKILVMDQGKLVEVGTHVELMAKQGLYAEMFSKQYVGTN